MEKTIKDLINYYKITMVKSSILILGSSSFLGKPLVKELEKRKVLKLFASRKKCKRLIFF